MPRRKVTISKEYVWKSQVCFDPRYQGSTKWRLAMHLAMKRDQEHVKWGSKNGLKVDYTDWSEAMKIAKRILQIIEAKPEKYR